MWVNGELLIIDRLLVNDGYGRQDPLNTVVSDVLAVLIWGQASKALGQIRHHAMISFQTAHQTFQ